MIFSWAGLNVDSKYLVHWQALLVLVVVTKIKLSDGHRWSTEN